MLSSHVSPRSTRYSEDENNPRAKRIQCSLSKNNIRGSVVEKKIKVRNFKESANQAYCLNLCKKID